MRSVLKWKTTGLMKVRVATLRSGMRKLAPIDTATNNSATSAAEAGAEQHVKIMLTAIVIVDEFAGMSRLCRV